MKIYVAYHKSFPVAKTDVLTPIWAGKAVSKAHLNFIGDDTGNNISQKNPYFSELTVLYWIWKNSKEDIVGLCHYRRYFNFMNDRVKINKITKNLGQYTGNTAKKIYPLFDTYDIILPNLQGKKRNPISLYDQYAQEHISHDIDLVLKVIKEKYPNQYKIAHQTLKTATKGYFANMLLAKKKVFDAYAKWLFDILFEVEKQIQPKVLKRTPYQQRVYGFLSERLMTVYIALHPELKVKTVPCLFIEEDKKEYRKYMMRYYKRKILTAIGLRKKDGKN